MAGAYIDLDAMQTLVDCMNRASESLQHEQSSLNGILSGVSLSTAPAAPLGTAASWVDSEVPGLRRRLALAQQTAKANPKFAKSAVKIEEGDLSKLTPAQAQAAAKQAAEKIKNGERVDGDLAKLLHDNASDPYFASALAKAASPKQIATYMSKVMNDFSYNSDGMRTRGEYDKNMSDLKTTLSGLGVALGTATQQTSPDLKLPDDYADKYADEITDQDNINGEGTILSSLMRKGTFGTDFLNTVAPKVYDYEHDVMPTLPIEQRQKWSGRLNTDWASVVDGDNNSPLGSLDPMANVLGGLGNNPAAAQEFFNTGVSKEVTIDGKKVWISERMQYLIQKRQWSKSAYSDEGDGLGSALQAATTYYRNDESSGMTSADLATQAIALTGQWQKGDEEGGDGDDKQMYTGMRSHIASILGSYGPDIMRIAGRNNKHPNELDLGTTNASNPGFPDVGKGGVYGMNLDKSLLDSVMGTLGEDKANVQKVMAGGVAAQQMALAYAMKVGVDPHAPGGSPDNPVKLIKGLNVPLIDNANLASADMFQYIVSSGFAGMEDKEERAQAKAQMMSQVLGVVTSLPPLQVEGKWASFALGTIEGQVLDKIGEGSPSSSKAVYGAMDDDTKTALQDNVLNTLLANGYLDKKHFDAANGKVGNTYVAPTDDMFVKGADGRVTHPKRFDFASQAYQSWARGPGVAQALTEGTIGRYNDDWPNINKDG